jgi:DNA-binding phage protein
MRLFDERDVIHLLQAEVKRTGGQTAWARKTGFDRPMLNKILSGRLSPTKKIIDLLNLRLVYVSKNELPNSK